MVFEPSDEHRALVGLQRRFGTVDCRHRRHCGSKQWRLAHGDVHDVRVSGSSRVASERRGVPSNATVRRGRGAVPPYAHARVSRKVARHAVPQAHGETSARDCERSPDPPDGSGGTSRDRLPNDHRRVGTDWALRVPRQLEHRTVRSCPRSSTARGRPRRVAVERVVRREMGKAAAPETLAASTVERRGWLVVFAVHLVRARRDA